MKKSIIQNKRRFPNDRRQQFGQSGNARECCNPYFRYAILVSEVGVGDHWSEVKLKLLGVEMKSDRYKRGWEKLKEIDGRAGERVIEALKDIAPDLAEYTIEFPFGDVYSRGVLSLKEREIATVAALAALGNAQPQLEVHIHGALNVGCTRQEIVEIMIQMAVYAGFPAALNGIFAAKEVFTERDKEGRKN